MIHDVVAPPPDAARWQRIEQAVHGWRGAMIDLFARAEADVTDTLLAVGCASSELLVGARFDRLARAVSVDGSHGRHGGPVRGALAAFRQHDPLRHALCHGVARVAIDRQGQWLLLLRLVRLQGGAAARTQLVIEQGEAEPLAATVRAAGNVLRGQLRRLREVSAAEAAAPPQTLGEAGC